MSKDSSDKQESEHRRIATEMHDRWKAGEAKSRLEIEYWKDLTSHGKAFTSYVRRWLGVETEKKSSQSMRVGELEDRLRVHGISPSDAGDLAEEYRLLAKARESALAAVRVYNDPTAGFRTEIFILVMIVAWNSLMQAMLERDHIDYYERDEDGNQVLIDGQPKMLGTRQLLDCALSGRDKRALRENLDFFIGLRNRIAHRYLPALDLVITGQVQALLLNFERVLVEEFGEVSALGNQLCVPLQLSAFRSNETSDALRAAQSRLPTDVNDYLTQHRSRQDDEVLDSPEYCLQIFFVPVAANREGSADSVVRFVPLGGVTPELEAELAKTTVVAKRRVTPVASHDLFKPSEVVNLVVERLPHRFTLYTHTQCWRYFKVRPASGAGEPEATDDRYCRWDRLMNGYGYTQAWIEKLVKELSDAATYEKVVGYEPDRR